LPLELSQTIAKQVQIAVTDSTPHSAINPEAHDAYLHGRYFWFSENGESLPYFEKAVQLQPDYAAAWSGVSDDYALRAVSCKEPPQGLRTTWEADARKAVELDGSLADAHNSLAGWYLFGAWDWKSAAAESQRALTTNPNYAEAYHLYSYILTVANHPNEALEIQKHGMELDPFARPWALGLTYYHLRQFDAAISELRLHKQAEASDVSTREILAGALRLAGRDQEAVDEWEQVYRLQGDPEGLAGIQEAFAKGGLRGAAEWRLRHRKYLSRRKYLSPFWLALTSAQAQHREETLQLLENAYRERSPRLVFLQNEPDFDFLHADPRYKAIAHKMGLPGLQQ
jgi:Tfp pilus assembly protein PilF